MTDIKPGDRVTLTADVETVAAGGTLLLPGGWWVHPDCCVSVEVIAPPMPRWEQVLREAMNRRALCGFDSVTASDVVAEVGAALNPEPQPESWQPGDVVLDAKGVPWQRTSTDRWWCPGFSSKFDEDHPTRPLRLLARDGKPVT